MAAIKIWKSNRGTSLVEILVVMVVLLVGIMTVVRMFPVGFGVVKAAESQTIATRLAQQELERWKNLAANLPDGIVPVDENGNVLNSQLPGPPFEGITRNGDGTFSRGNVLNIRQVEGETTSIPMASRFRTAGGINFGSRYTLAFGPIDLRYNANNEPNITIRSGDLRRRTGDSGYAPPYLRPGEYAIDYELVDGRDYGGQLVFHVAFPKDLAVRERKYYISYSYSVAETADAEPKLYSVVSQPVHRNGMTTVAGGDDDWIEVPVPTAGLPEGAQIEEVERYSDSCARGFIDKGPNAPWGDSPYEYYIADPLLGIIAFNPKGHGLYEYTARGIRPIVARIDYLIYDLRILREDKVVPQPGTGVEAIPVKLALRFILDAGDPIDQTDGSPTDNPDEPTFEGLVSIGTNKKALSVLVIDLATGLRVDDPSVTHDAALSKLPIVNVDHAAGIVKLPLKADLMDADGNVAQNNVDLAGRHLRFLYRADGDWAMQCTKAYTAYTRKYGGGDPSYREFKYQTGTNRLLFAPCEWGKTVIVDYSYKDADGVEKKVVGEAHKIETDPVSNEVCVHLAMPPDASVTRITVVGTSFTVRIIWRDGARWRNVDLDTYLTRS